MPPDRPTTFGLSNVWRSLGVKGGRMPALADSPLQPVVIAADFSTSQSPEAVEARAYVGFTQSNSGGPCAYLFAATDIVVEAVTLASTAATVSANKTFGPPATPTQAFSWLVGVLQDGPSTLFTNIGTYRETATGALVDGSVVGTLGSATKLDVGGLPTRSNVYGFAGSYATSLNTIARTYANQQPLPTPRFWDPMDWAGTASTGATWSLTLPPVVALGGQASPLRWYLPSGTGLLIVNADLSADAPGYYFTFEFLWRELPPLGSP